MLELLFHILSAYQPVADFVGRREHPLRAYVTPRRKIAALASLCVGDGKPCKNIVETIRDRRDYAAKEAPEMLKEVAMFENLLMQEKMMARPNPDNIKSWEISLAARRNIYTALQRTKASKEKEEASLEACRRFIEAMRAAHAKQAGKH